MSKIFTVTLPDIGEGVVEGEVVAWLKQPNDRLEQDEPVVVVMTDKATVELPAPYPGKLVKQYYEIGQIAAKDRPLYDIETDLSQEKAETKQPAATKAQASPATRKLARDLSIDINQVQGTGKENIVTTEDVKKFHEKKQAPITALSDEKPLMGIPGLMAKKVQESKKNIPDFSYFEQADATHLIQLRKRYQEKAASEQLQITFMPFLIRALSLTLQRYPQVNSSFNADHNSIVIHRQHNIGVAVATSMGLIVPVLKHVDTLSLEQIIRSYEDLKVRALSNRLDASEMKDATITISNFGVLSGGGLWATPIINYPEAAILAVSRIHKEPVVKNDAVVIRDVLNLSWSFDHRIVDGQLAAQFSNHFRTLLQNPAPLI